MSGGKNRTHHQSESETGEQPGEQYEHGSYEQGHIQRRRRAALCVCPPGIFVARRGAPIQHP